MSSIETSTKTINSIALNFLQRLWPEDVAPYWLLMWTMGADGKRSHWFRTVEEAATFAAETTADAVYFGLGLSGQNPGPHRRCKSEEIVALPGFGVDLDVAGPAHTKLGLPRTKEEAYRILPTDFPPTIVVDSGHGLQAFWLLRERWELASDDERRHAAALSQRMHRWVESRATALGYTVDSVYDLSRVFRLPGTVNKKVTGDHREVRLWE